MCVYVCVCVSISELHSWFLFTLVTEVDISYHDQFWNLFHYSPAKPGSQEQLISRVCVSCESGQSLAVTLSLDLLTCALYTDGVISIRPFLI